MHVQGFPYGPDTSQIGWLRGRFYQPGLSGLTILWKAFPNKISYPAAKKVTETPVYVQRWVNTVGFGRIWS